MIMQAIFRFRNVHLYIQISERSTTGQCSMECGHQGGTTVISTVGKTEKGGRGRRGKKKWSGVVERESICEDGMEEREEEEEGEEGAKERGEKDGESGSDDEAEPKES